jgi:hypothetical protein
MRRFSCTTPSGPIWPLTIKRLKVRTVVYGGIDDEKYERESGMAGGIFSVCGNPDAGELRGYVPVQGVIGTSET